MESCECSYMSQENPVYPVNPVLSLYASGDAPASEVSNRWSGKGCIPTLERGNDQNLIQEANHASHRI